MPFADTVSSKRTTLVLKEARYSMAEASNVAFTGDEMYRPSKKSVLKTSSTCRYEATTLSSVAFEIDETLVLITVTGIVAVDAEGSQVADSTAFGCFVLARYEISPSSKMASPYGLFKTNVYGFLFVIGTAQAELNVIAATKSPETKKRLAIAEDRQIIVPF